MKAEKITSDIIWKQLDIIGDKCGKVKEFGLDSLIADLSSDTMITQFMAPGFNMLFPPEDTTRLFLCKNNSQCIIFALMIRIHYASFSLL